jgi:hypothetical protein
MNKTEKAIELLQEAVNLLKESAQEPKEGKLQAGKWYKSTSNSNFLVFLSEHEELDKNKGYGFNGAGSWNEWTGEGDLGYFGLSKCVLATEQEVKEALINYAGLRYKDAAKLGTPTLESSTFIKDDIFGYEYCSTSKTLWAKCQGISYVIFREGKWAEIIPEEQIDWNKPQLVEGKNTGVIIFCTGKHTEGEFSGMVVAKGAMQAEGYFSNGWNKEYFKHSNKTLKIE